jgi:pimeloyl-ACP methyl ester carboxylesterase
MAGLADSGTRAAFLSTLRAVVGPVGQRVFAGDRLYLAAEMPTLIIWGDRDPIIPIGHGRRAHAAIAGSDLVVLEGVGHMPLVEAPEALAAAIERFVAEHPPSSVDLERWRDLLRTGA